MSTAPVITGDRLNHLAGTTSSFAVSVENFGVMASQQSPRVLAEISVDEQRGCF